MSETIIIRRTGQAPLRVRGEEIATNESSLNGASASYSGTGRSLKVQVIKTTTGNYVVATHHISLWQGEYDTNEASVFPGLKQCVAYLSERVPNWMLKELIEELGEEAVAEEVD